MSWVKQFQSSSKGYFCKVIRMCWGKHTVFARNLNNYQQFSHMLFLLFTLRIVWMKLEEKNCQKKTQNVREIFGFFPQPLKWRTVAGVLRNDLYILAIEFLWNERKIKLLVIVIYIVWITLLSSKQHITYKFKSATKVSIVNSILGFRFILYS